MSDVPQDALNAAAEAWEQAELFEKIAVAVQVHFVTSPLVCEHHCSCNVTSIRRITDDLYVVRYSMVLPLEYFDSPEEARRYESLRVAKIAEIFAMHGGSLEGVEIVTKTVNGNFEIVATQKIARRGQ